MEFIVLIFMIVIVVAILWHTLVASFMRAVIGIVATCYAVWYAIGTLQAGQFQVPPVGSIVFVGIVATLFALVVGLPYLVKRHVSKETPNAP